MVYHEALVKNIISSDPAYYAKFGKTTREIVEGACRAGANGELMGYGQRALMEPGFAVVSIFIEDVLVAGFQTRAEDAALFAGARVRDFSDYFERPARYEIRYPKG